MRFLLSPFMGILVVVCPAYADDGSARYHCEGKNQDISKVTVEFDFLEDGYVEGNGYGSEVISITRIGKRSVVPAYRFQRMGATEDNVCEPDPFGDHFLFNFTQIPNHGSDSDRYPYKVSFRIECADMPLLNVSARCELR